MGLGGVKAGRLIRLLADVFPPYGVRDIAMVTGLNAGYVSQLLHALERESLILREHRGPVWSVDVPALLRRRAQSLDGFRASHAAGFVSPDGPAAALERLARANGLGRFAITGSFAAARRAALLTPAILAVYCDDMTAVAAELRLVPVDAGGNVTLIRPFDPVVWTRTEHDGELAYTAVAQVAVDCLTSDGRTSSEGDALLRWMSENQMRWRVASLDALPPSTT